jgi:putative ABC transport system permease protein
MIRLGLRMLFGDRAKYGMLVSGIVFATLLITQGSALFVGIMSWMSATLRNVRSEIWVADPRVEMVADQKPLRDTDVDRVRSVSGVAWAAPLYSGLQTVKFVGGGSKQVTLIGLDATTLAGAPPRMLEGTLEDLRLPDGVIIDRYGVTDLGKALGRPLQVGDAFELNDRRAVVVGICEAYRSFTGGAYLFTTYDRALAFVPAQRKTTSYVLAGPVEGADAASVARAIEAETGLKAFTEREFTRSTILWYVANTGIVYNIGTIILIGLIVGTVVSGQTFYSFVLENTRNLAALKAMGAGNASLCAILVIQSITVGLIGFGIGQGVVATLGRVLLSIEKVPFLLVWQIPVGVLAAIVGICVFAALLGIVRVARLEAALVFRS